MRISLDISFTFPSGMNPLAIFRSIFRIHLCPQWPLRNYPGPASSVNIMTMPSQYRLTSATLSIPAYKRSISTSTQRRFSSTKYFTCTYSSFHALVYHACRQNHIMTSTRDSKATNHSQLFPWWSKRWTPLAFSLSKAMICSTKVSEPRHARFTQPSDQPPFPILTYLRLQNLK